MNRYEDHDLIKLIEVKNNDNNKKVNMKFEKI